MDDIKKDNGLKMEITHEAVPGYPRALTITIIVAVAYLAYIFIASI